LINHTIAEVDALNEDFIFRGVALLRAGRTLIPEGNTILRKGDHLYIATRKQHLDKAMAFVGKQLKPVKKVMIVGGTALAIKTAKLIEEHYQVTIVMQDRKRERECVEMLDSGLVIHADPGNIDTLKEENLEKMDAFIALTPNSETNIITSLMAEELGVYKTIALVDNVNYTLASLHGVDAEMIEFEIHKNNRLTQRPIKELHFPKKSIIAGIIRGEESYIPTGDFRFEINDKVIVLVLPEAIHQVEEIFK